MANFFTGKDPAIRQTRYAGSWYTASPDLLQEQIQGFRANVNDEDSPSQPKVLAIISPHAGYRYSGQTAAFAFKQVESIKPGRVFLLGPSHYKAFHGIAIPEASSFATPFGALSVATEVINELSGHQEFIVRQDVHDIEHSLEIQLPFIHQELGAVPLVPLVVGRFHNTAELEAASTILRSVIRNDDLVIVSSDFTHYGPNYDYVPFNDPAGTQVKVLDLQAFSYIRNKDIDGFIRFEQETGATICGFYPIILLLSLLPKEAEARLIYHTTSRELYPDAGNNSVSYMAIEFRAPVWHPTANRESHKESSNKDKEKAHKPAAVNNQTYSQESLTSQEKNDLLTLARASLAASVNNQALPAPQNLGIQITPHLQQKQATFVTLYRLPYPRASHSLKELRGCIGNIYPKCPLWESVGANTTASALHDPRFLPVSPEELPLLFLEINILDFPQEIASWKDIVLGKMGIILIKNNKQAVFLPHVATEFGWTLEETLTQLAIKAGLAPDEWRSGTTFLVFGATIIEDEET